MITTITDLGPTGGGGSERARGSEEIAQRLRGSDAAMPERVARVVSQICEEIGHHWLAERVAADLLGVGGREWRAWKRRYPEVTMELARAHAQRVRGELAAYRRNHWGNWRALVWLAQHCASVQAAERKARKTSEAAQGEGWCLSAAQQRRLQQIRKESRAK